MYELFSPLRVAVKTSASIAVRDCKSKLATSVPLFNCLIEKLDRFDVVFIYSPAVLVSQSLAEVRQFAVSLSGACEIFERFLIVFCDAEPL